MRLGLKCGDAAQPRSPFAHTVDAGNEKALSMAESFLKCGFYAEYRTIQEHYRVFADICVAFPEFEILP